MAVHDLITTGNNRSDAQHCDCQSKAWILDIALLTGGQHEQQRFTILEVAADWHELMIPWCGMQPSTARDSGQVDPRRSTTDIPPPQSAALGLHPVARRLLLINRPRRDGTLSRRVGTEQPRVGVEPATSRSQSPASYHSATAYRHPRVIDG